VALSPPQISHGLDLTRAFGWKRQRLTAELWHHRKGLMVVSAELAGHPVVTVELPLRVWQSQHESELLMGGSAELNAP
jgi:hypothetical protein